MWRITYEDRGLRVRIEELQRQQHRVRVGFVALDVIRRNQHLEMAVESARGQALQGSRTLLRGHDPEFCTGCGDFENDITHPGIFSNHRIVICEVVVAICLHHCGDLVIAVGELPKLHDQRSPQALEPDIIGRDVVQVDLHGVPKRRQDKVDRVDECSVEVEKEGLVFEHGGNLPGRMAQVVGEGFNTLPPSYVTLVTLLSYGTQDTNARVAKHLVKHQSRVFLALGLAFAALAAPVSAQITAATSECPGATDGARIVTARRAYTVRVQGEPPEIDGVLDDPAWEGVPPITRLIQREPREGEVVSESTTVRFVYTDKDLYVGFRGYDSQRPYGRLVRRDQRTAADYFNLYIDSYYNQLQAYEFAINPSGARRDVFIYQDGRGRDDSWDPVYHWATKIDSLGWTVEMRIPFSQLRFASGDSLTFGLRVRRAINRKNEEANWPFFPRDIAGEVSQFGDLVGFVSVPAPRQVEFLPYAAGSAAFVPAEPGNPFLDNGKTQDYRVGGDVKVGVTSGLTLDATINPDFGQVEADAAQVNLTAFETFFPEKRPFFIEGTNLYQFRLTPSSGFAGFFGGGGRGAQEGLVYTRRIGRQPHFGPNDMGGYAEIVTQTTILGAAKMSGEIGKGWQLGVMQAFTNKEYASVVDSLGNPNRSAVEPFSSYSVLRIGRSTNQGRLSYGVLGTAVARKLDEPRFELLHDRAFTAGADLRARFGGNDYDLQISGMGSYVQGSQAAITLTQLRSSRYFQRPDQDYVELDTTRTYLGGYAGFAQLAKVQGFTNWKLRFDTRSPGFESNDLGFLRRADALDQRAEFDLRWLQPGKIFRRFTWSFDQSAQFNYGLDRTQTQVSTRLNADFHNWWNLNVNIERAFDALNTRMLRGGPAFRTPGRWEFRLSWRTDFRRPVQLSAGVTRVVEDYSGATGWRTNARLGLRPPGRFGISFDGRVSRTTNDRQFVTFRPTADSTYYVLGRLDRQDASLTIRVDFAITPRLSLEFYAEPFVSAGVYSPLRLAHEVRADDYDLRQDVLGPDRMNRPGEGELVDVDADRDGTVDFSFFDPNFRVISLRTNAVVRWEFNPGSTLFFVWQQNRGQIGPNGSDGLTGGIADGFRDNGVNVFMVKVAYWIGM